MNHNLAIRNHSLWKDLKRSPQEAWEKRVGKKPGNPPGYETPLGHTYSLILEALARAGLDATPDLQGFLDFVDSFQTWYNKGTKAETPTYHRDSTDAVARYMIDRGLPEPARREVMMEILGPEGEGIFT